MMDCWEHRDIDRPTFDQIEENLKTQLHNDVILFFLPLMQCIMNISYLFIYRRGFRLPQRSHLRTLKNFVSQKSGKHWIKSGNRGILRRYIFFLYPRMIYSMNIYPGYLFFLIGFCVVKSLLPNSVDNKLKTFIFSFSLQYYF